MDQPLAYLHNHITKIASITEFSIFAAKLHLKEDYLLTLKAL